MEDPADEENEAVDGTTGQNIGFEANFGGQGEHYTTVDYTRPMVGH